MRSLIRDERASTLVRVVFPDAGPTGDQEVVATSDMHPSEFSACASVRVFALDQVMDGEVTRGELADGHHRAAD